MSCFRSESLSVRRTLQVRLVWIAPAFTVFLACLFYSVAFEAQALYWCGYCIAPAMLSFMCGLSIQHERDSTRFYPQLSSGVNPEITWRAKVFLLAVQVVLMHLALLGLILLVRQLIPTAVHLSFTTLLSAALILAAVTLWEIPLCLVLSYRFSLFAPIIANGVLGLFLSGVFAETVWGWIVPFAWPGKILFEVAGIGANGICTGVEVPIPIVPLLVLSAAAVALFFAVTAITAAAFSSWRSA